MHTPLSMTSHRYGFHRLAVALGLCCIAGCKPESGSTPEPSDNRRLQHIDGDERTAAAKLKPATDPVQDEIDDFREEMHAKFGARRFDDLEKAAADLRATKALFRNGNWKLVDFYESFACGHDADESLWQKEEALHKEWIAAKPESLTARLAHVRYLCDYAWNARGAGYANTVTAQAARLFGGRLSAAADELKKAQSLPEKDPVWWYLSLRVGLGQGWPKQDFDDVVAAAHAYEPRFWHTDAERAYSLLPRWYGSPGDWEAYAAEAADQKEGLGVEAYAHIVMRLVRFHENVFRDARASWPRTREGLDRMGEKYPDAIEFKNYRALLATMAFDQAAAKAAFEALGDTYVPYIWKDPVRFAHYRKWAQTGNW